MKAEFEESYKKFIEVWGIDSQLLMCMEEMGELIQAISKYKRYKGTDKESAAIENLIEEIGDVLNVAEQLEYYFGVEKIEGGRQQKIERALKKIT